MEHRQQGRAVVEDAFPVGFRHRPADFLLILRRAVPPVGGGVLLGLVCLAAGYVVAGVGLGVIGAAAGGNLVEDVGPGRHSLGLQRLQLKGGGHFCPHDPQEVGFHIHLLELIPRHHVQRRGLVHRGERGFPCGGLDGNRVRIGIRRHVSRGGRSRFQLRERVLGGPAPQPGEEK